ncbi:MAG: lytic transglycosylase domain-containing protein, partial [Flavobacteriaceae bacterium]|nr:lytic transglycosylase domain-containing protein [Flavobacteriaceae bacterium]
MSKITKIGAALALIAIGGIMINAVQDPPTDVNLKAKIINDYNIYALPLPERLTFADEVISLKDPNIKERFDRELLVNTYWQSNGLLLFKRANKYFPIIEPILKRYGIPDDFKYIAVIESGLQNVVSPAGARGFWQIMPATGKEKGLEVNKNVDERYHLEMATEVACKYFLEAKNRLGTWMLAAASYDTGQSGMSRRLEEQQVDSYFDLLLGEEAGRYLFRVLALKEIMTQPKKYGFNFREKDLYTL